MSDSCSTVDDSDNEVDYLWTTLDDFQTAMKAEKTYVPKTYKAKNKVTWNSDVAAAAQVLGSNHPPVIASLGMSQCDPDNYAA
mgnify:CR=1 FL=1